MLSVPEPGGARDIRAARFQSHGAVLVVDSAEIVQYVTAGCERWIGHSTDHVVGEQLAEVLPGLMLGNLVDPEEDALLGPAWHRVQLGVGLHVRVRAFQMTPELTGIDVVEIPSSGSATEAATVERIMRWTARLQAASTRRDLLREACAVATSLTGFEGAWAIRIEDDQNGFVEAVSVSGGAPDTTGGSVSAVHLPPGHPTVFGRPVPFFVADVLETAVDLTPAAPVHLDFSRSALHRPYDAYLEFLGSIGVRSVFSVPVMADGKTWLRLIGHHPRPRVLWATVQSELRLVGMAIAVRLQELLDQERGEQRELLTSASDRVMAAVSKESSLATGLTSDTRSLLELCAATSAIVKLGDVPLTVGEPLSQSVLDAVLTDAHVKLTASATRIVASATMPFTVGGHAGGYLAMALDETRDDLVIWIRPERRRTVQWVTVDQPDRLAQPPSEIKEVVGRAGRDESSSSEPWTRAQLDAVEAFRTELASVVMSRYGALESAVGDLRRSNNEFDAFAHTVAHDLRQPFRGIAHSIQFYLEDADDRLEAADREQLDTVLRLTKRGTSLLDDLMEYAQLGEAKWSREQVDVQVAAAEAIEQLDQDAVKAADISVEPGMITADPSAVRQLLLNLIGNALKYSSGKPQVSVHLTTLERARRESSPPDRTNTAGGESAVLAVTDLGVGIPSELQSRVFGLFRRANASRPDVPGTGAGLAMCKRIAERHGGDIWLKSVPNEGTTVYALLASE